MVKKYSTNTIEAAKCLLAVRNGGPKLIDLPTSIRPTNIQAAYDIQDALLEQVGPVSGWKVGAADAAAEPFRAALTEETIVLSPVSVAHTGHAVLGVEAEIVYRFDHALPLRDKPYSDQEVMDAIGSVHAAIELVDTNFAVWKSASYFSQIADQFNHAYLIIGSGREGCAQIDAYQQPVKMAINGETFIEQRGGNAAGPAIRMLTWLANSGAINHGGIKAGAYVTTGSWTGVTFIAPHSRIEVTFDSIGSVIVDVTG